MIYNDDVLFVHIPKCGGMSVRAYMYHNLPGCVDHSHEASPFPDEHVPLRDVPLWTGRPLDSWKLVLAVMRDPYEQCLSQWVHWRDGYARGGRHPCEMTAAAHPTLMSWLMEPYSHFGFFYERHRRERSEDEAREAVFGLGYYEYWLSVDRALPANLHILRFEHLAEAVPAFLSQLAEPRTTFPHANSAVLRDAKQYYTPNGVQEVEARYPMAFRGPYPKRDPLTWEPIS